MSAGARVTLAVVGSLFAVAFAALGALYGEHFPKGRAPFYGLAVFCELIALACLSARSRPVAVRMIGAAIFGACAFYVYDTDRGPGFRRALAAFVTFGLPA